MPQDERRAIFEEQSHRLANGHVYTVHPHWH